MQIEIEYHGKLKATLEALREARLPNWTLWRMLADYYLPRRYTWLLSPTERKTKTAHNPFILDGTGTKCARTLASGMMNGVTSPARPWFKLRLAGLDDDADNPARLWLDEVTRRMLIVMAQSNFYNALAVMYLDLVIFGTAAMLIYEDRESVIRCFNPNLGEFYIAQSDRLQVNTFAREFEYTVAQCEQRFGRENLSDTLKEKCKAGGAKLQEPVAITHLIEPNTYSDPNIGKRFPFREYYWETNATSGGVLSAKGYFELPGIFPRWETSGNDAYGNSPGMDAMGDVIQLQHETKKKGQGLDKMVSPPMVADIQLKNKPTALLPNGVTYVAGQNNVGMKPAYEIRIPLQELTMDIREVQSRIAETFHNDLFRMISQLETVRSATEIDARQEEKLVLLGSVLERFENEALDPGIDRIFGIMQRSGLIPPAPDGIQTRTLEIQYESILSVAQRAVGVVPTERWLTLIGNVAAIYPKALNIPNFDQILVDYGNAIGVPARGINPLDMIKELGAQQDSIAQQQEQANQGQVLVNSAEQLSKTDVGGGANALQRLMGA